MPRTSRRKSGNGDAPLFRPRTYLMAYAVGLGLMALSPAVRAADGTVSATAVPLPFLGSGTLYYTIKK